MVPSQILLLHLQRYLFLLWQKRLASRKISTAFSRACLSLLLPSLTLRLSSLFKTWLILFVMRKTNILDF